MGVKRLIQTLHISLLLVFAVSGRKKAFIDPADPAPGFCKPGFKKDEQSGSCVQITNRDILESLHWLAAPPRVSCKKETTVQGVAVCEDYLPADGTCTIVSTVSTIFCDFYGSLEFEKYWSSRCRVFLFHFTLGFKGNACSLGLGSTFPPGTRRIGAEGGSGPFTGYSNITVIRNDMWGARCFNCLYRTLFDVEKLTGGRSIDVLKIQQREGVSEDMEGVQLSILSDMYIHMSAFAKFMRQIAFTASINSVTLQDNVGREGEMAWNFWGTRQFLSNYVSFSSRAEQGRLQPRQFEHLLVQAEVNPNTSFYHHSMARVDLLTQEHQQKNARSEQEKIKAWNPQPPPYELVKRVPTYCKAPSEEARKIMATWIHDEINARCHPNRLWVVCDRTRTYDAFLPCPQELMDNLAEDYAASKGWCDFNHKAAELPELTKIDPRAVTAFQRPKLSIAKPGLGGTTVRLAFFFTIYADEAFVRRLLGKLYSPEHYYLLHVDPAGSSSEFKAAMRDMAETYNSKYGNVFIASDVPIVYGASTATILLSKTMAWFARHTSGWDYLVAVTGSDYPLVPLARMEKILSWQSRKSSPMPFVMAWTPGTSTHIFRLEKTHSVFETDSQLAQSIKTVLDERGKVLGAVPMEYRSTNFGPPLFCNGKKSFYHLDNRRNKSGQGWDTQWLFPRDKIPLRGRAYPDEVPTDTTPSFDGVFRVWKKSDPATTGVYDRESVDYIVNSSEGKKYYHFFKHMLLGSEEHYYVSLLYNWKRTKSFVQTLSAQTVWNTWELGLWEQSTGFQTHTHFLSPAEMSRLQGFAKRGMLFARKFSSKKTPELLEMLDAYIHNNASTDAGLFWPGFLDVDIWTPGKQWVAEYHRNVTLRRNAEARVKKSWSVTH